MNNELHGTAPNLRIKWSCMRCKKRNDHAVRFPPTRQEIYICRHCKRATAIGFQTKAENACEPMPTEFTPSMAHEIESLQNEAEAREIYGEAIVDQFLTWRTTNPWAEPAIASGT
jgi:DNA-directed RNA polymerase subunit RPC12/RpoP